MDELPERREERTLFYKLPVVVVENEEEEEKEEDKRRDKTRTLTPYHGYWVLSLYLIKIIHMYLLFSKFTTRTCRGSIIVISFIHSNPLKMITFRIWKNGELPYLTPQNSKPYGRRRWR